jgi:hypothetical protein
MHMTEMNAGPVEGGIDTQHTELAALRDAYPDSTVIPVAAVSGAVRRVLLRRRAA